MTMTDRTGLGWLLDELVDRAEHVRQALLLSADGLATAASRGMAGDDIDHMAALCAGFHSLAKGVGRQFAVGGVRQTMVMADEGYLFVTPAADGSVLAVLCGAQADVGQVGFEMSRLVQRVGRHLATPARS